MPPSRPCSGRRRSSTAPSGRVSQNATPQRCGRSGFSARAGSDSASPAAAGSATLAPRAQHAARPARRADRGAEIHHRLREVAGPLLRDQRRGERLETRLGERQRLAYGVKAGDDALDIAVDRCLAPVEGDRRDRRRGVAADPGECAQGADVVRKDATMALDHGARAGMQVAGAGVVAEPLPEPQNVVERRCG